MDKGIQPNDRSNQIVLTSFLAKFKGHPFRVCKPQKASARAVGFEITSDAMKTRAGKSARILAMLSA